MQLKNKSWGRFLLQKLIVAQLLKRLVGFMEPLEIIQNQLNLVHAH